MAGKGGFSLVELSIVLVILGLLVGGILTGRSLIRAAELRSITTEYHKYITAVHTFKDKYFALPGDMKNATAFWGLAAVCPGGATDGTLDGTTCNGDGNGEIDLGTGEPFRVWQHLANAGFIEGIYNGVRGPDGGQHAIIGVNAPASKFPGGGWFAKMRGSWGGDAGRFGGDYGHVLHFGGQRTTWLTAAAILTPEEVWNIDMKMDDGKPSLGKLVVMPWGACTDAIGSNGLNAGGLPADYLLTQTDIVCSIIFARVF